MLGLCPAYCAPLCKTVVIGAFARGWPREAKRERSGHASPIPTVSVEIVTEDAAFGSVLECFLADETATEHPIRRCVAKLVDSTRASAD